MRVTTLPPYKRVLVKDINLTTRLAQCVDQFGGNLQVRVDVGACRTGGPRIGEEWFVGKVLSESWSFVALCGVPAAESALFLVSPDGTRYKITVANGGTLEVHPA